MGMQEELRLLEQRWGLALHSADFGVWDLDIANQRVHYSPQWKAMLGYDHADEADSTATWRDRVHPDDLAPMLERQALHREGKTPGYEFEFRIRAADGDYRWVLSRGRVVERDATGAALRMVGTLTDLTDRKQAEALRAARDQALAATQAKTQFLSRMSHELRTPLNAVLGFAQLLAQQLGDGHLDEQRRSLAHIEEAGWQLLTLIDDVLELGRIERGQLQMHLEPVPLAPLLQAALDGVRSQATAREVALAPCTVTADATVRGDGARLAQVLKNLVGNAVKYNRRGGTVAIAVEPADNAWALTVADTGIGISAVQMAHLFEPFNRLGRDASGPAGVGIGLVLTRWLVDAMHGRLSVHSVEGQGSRFTVTLPRVPAPA